MELLKVENLFLGYRNTHLSIVEDVSFFIRAGEVWALVGESGCGKTLTGLAIIGLLPESITLFSGRILFQGQNLTNLTPEARRRLCGSQIAMIFQDPMTSLNPVFSIGEQIKEVLVLHKGFNKQQAHEEALALLDMVGFSAPREQIHSYPHQLSGGMRQRAMIAMALAGSPSLLIADEPTTALDVTIQRQILYLLKDLKNQKRLTIFLISHDLGVVAELADRVAVMYAGFIVEEASVKDIFSSPLHPYTQLLLKALPRFSKHKLAAIPGQVPNPEQKSMGCPFYNRCPIKEEKCKKKRPSLKEKPSLHKVRCFKR